jgi:starch synthase
VLINNEEQVVRILMLCEGDAESWDSWSGISKSLVDQLRIDGHEVQVANVDVDRADRWVAAASTFAFDRRHWATRYHLARVPFALRSRRARRHIAARRGWCDVILQIGATFETGTAGIPYCLCCDSNIRVAQQGASSGYSDAAALTTKEVEEIARRELGVYRGAAAIFPLSERLRQSFVDDFGIPADRVRAINAGPNFGGPRVLPAAAPRTGDGSPTVLFVGRQFHRKGGDVLVESFRRVRRELPSAKLVIAGVPTGSVQGPGITCLGDLDKNSDEGWAELSQAYRSADVFALPTRFEPFGIAFVEAMHFGLPCIGPSAWAVPEIIADGETGFTVPVDDVDALTNRLLQLFRDPPLRQAMGNAGRDRAQRLFTWAKVTERMTDLMSAIVGEPDAVAHLGIGA